MAAMLGEPRLSPYGGMLTCPHGHDEVWEQWAQEAGCPRIALLYSGERI
jgi:hypothetical protein